MKLLTLLSVLFISCAVFAQTYRAGNTRRANFGGQPAQQQTGEAKSAVPGANSSVKTRTFTNYGATHTWSRGVQTQGVQTATAGTPAPETNDEPAAVARIEKKAPQAIKKAAGADAAAAPQAAPSAPAQPSQKDKQPVAAIPPEAASAMQQLQGMQDMMKALGGAAGGGANAAAGAAGLPAGMPNIPGMPDLSALMGGAAAGQPSGKK